jgi:RNA polymerase sigma factor (sigma-70 family)
VDRLAATWLERDVGTLPAQARSCPLVPAVPIQGYTAIRLWVPSLEGHLMAALAAFEPATARERMIERYLPLADSLARRYRYTTEPLDDLIQVARIGLMKAVDRWDPDRGNAFSSFAVPTITGELQRDFRDRTWTIEPPRDLQELYMRVQRTRASLSTPSSGTSRPHATSPTRSGAMPRTSSTRSPRETRTRHARSTRPSTLAKATTSPAPTS